jgi:hypothetical protein
MKECLEFMQILFRYLSGFVLKSVLIRSIRVPIVFLRNMS